MKTLNNLVGPWKDIRNGLRQQRDETLDRLRAQRDALKALVEQRALAGEQSQLALKV